MAAAGFGPVAWEMEKTAERSRNGSVWFSGWFRLPVFLQDGGQPAGCDFFDGDERSGGGRVRGDVFFEPDHVVPLAAFVAGVAVQARAGKTE